MQINPFFKLGHCQIQIRPLRVETGQRRTAVCHRTRLCAGADRPALERRYQSRTSDVPGVVQGHPMKEAAN
jgi:hypothetical protein